jgi:hypothetical protein
MSLYLVFVLHEIPYFHGLFPRQVHKKPMMDNVIQGSQCVPGMVGITPLSDIELNDSNALWVVATPDGQQNPIHLLKAIPEFHC